MGLIQDTETHIRECYEAIYEMGGELPAEKNLANLADAIGSKRQEETPEPGAPITLAELKEMLNAGQEIITGSIAADVYNSISNPLIVVKCGQVPLSNGSTKLGVYLQRSFITDVGQVWDQSDNTNYATSDVAKFLGGTYLTRCSAELRNMIVEVRVPTVTNSGATIINAKFFLPSVEEIYGDPAAQDGPGVGKEGSYFPYWKEQTGFSSPSNAATNGRAVPVNSSSGNAGGWWLRTRYSSAPNFAWWVPSNGATGGLGTIRANSVGVLPVCAITAD